MLLAKTNSSYAYSGSNFYLLTPFARFTDGIAYIYAVYSGQSNVIADYVESPIGYRPVISLNNLTEIDSGSGTATDPWTIK